MKPSSGSWKGMRPFLLLWVGQLVSVVGSSLTRFALGVWVFQRTGSATLFGLILLAGVIPGFVLSPFSGAIVDRFDRRWVMVLSDTAAALTSLALAALLVTDRLEIWHIYLVVGLNSAASTFQRPAYTAAVTLLVPREQLARAGGMAQMRGAAANVLAPLLAGFLVGSVGLGGVIVVDFATFLFALVTLAMVRIPSPPKRERKAGEPATFLHEATFGWKFILGTPGLLGLALYFAVVNVSMAGVNALLTPLVLSFTSAEALGAVVSFGGIGALLGSAAMSAWGGPRARMRGVVVSGIVLGVCITLAGARPSALLVSAALFGMFAAIPIGNACDTAIWQSKVRPEVQGRVFAAEGMVSMATVPLTYLAAGPLADAVFRPLLVPGGPLAGTLGPVLGVGPGRGIGLLLLLMGLLTTAAAVLLPLFPRVWNVERELPDAHDDEPAAVPDAEAVPAAG